MSNTGVAAGAPRLRDHVHGGTYFKCDGEGDAVVLIHGVGLDHTMWEQQVTGLKSQFQIIRYDMLGHGQSAHPPDERTLSDFVRQLHQLLMNLNVDCASIVGFSMGGMVAREFAATHPEMINKLVLMNSVFRRTPEQQNAVMGRYELAKSGGVQEGIEAAVARWFSPAFIDANPNVIKMIERRLRDNDPADYLKAYRVFATNEDPVENPLPIACPTLAMTGELDSGSTPEMTKALAAAIPDAEIKVLAGLRHMAALEDPPKVNTLLREFLCGQEE